VSHRSYSGRHRGHASIRRIPRSLSTGFALPTAAAAALVLTATGATVADAGPVSLDITGRQAAAMQARDTASQLTATKEHEEAEAVAMKHAAAQSRAQRVQQVARDRQRQAVAQRKAEAAKRKAEAAKQAALEAARQKAAAQAQKWVMPIDGATFTSGYGYRWGRLHAGNDFATPVGTPLVAMSSGVVTFAGNQGGYGNKVEIKYWDGTVSYYGHMNTFSVSVGQQVAPGELVGQSGNTGRSTGPHLHLEIHPGGGAAIDPAPWLSERGLQ
jgi:murein DD-endopeptidase MepM/ murein hydrolase activator NlpD